MKRITIMFWLFALACHGQMLVITHGGIYPAAGQQNFFINPATDFDHPVVVVKNTSEPVTITNLAFATAGWGIVVGDGANVRVTQCHMIYAGAPMQPNWKDPGWYGSHLVYASNPASFVCDHCRFEGNTQHVLVACNGQPTAANIAVANNCFIDPWCAIQFTGVVAPAANGNQAAYNNLVVDYPFSYHSDQLSFVNCVNCVFSQDCVICPGPNCPYIPTAAGIQVGDTGDINCQANGNIVINGGTEGVDSFQGPNGGTGNYVVGQQDDDPYQPGGILINPPGINSGNTCNWGPSVTTAEKWAAYYAWVALMESQGQQNGPDYLNTLGIMMQ